MGPADRIQGRTRPLHLLIIVNDYQSIEQDDDAVIIINTGQSKPADPVDFDAYEDWFKSLHSAVVGHHLQDVIVIFLIVERLCAADDSWMTCE